MKCSVEGCEKPAKNRDHLCSMHRARMTRHGDFVTRYPNQKVKTYLHDVVLRFSGDECLLWPFGDNGGGYARMLLNGQKVGVHRVVCEFVHGPPPSEIHHAAHLCGNGHKGCVNPHHLVWKTGKENCADKLIHGTDHRGEKSGKAKLTEADVTAIRRRASTEPHSVLAAEFEIHRKYVSALVRGVRWGHLHD